MGYKTVAQKRWRRAEVKLYNQQQMFSFHKSPTSTIFKLRSKKQNSN